MGFYFINLGNLFAIWDGGDSLEKSTKLLLEQYPLGRAFEHVNVAQDCYLYNSRELQDQAIGGTPFGWYDYGARFYDPELSVFHTMDPLAERFSFQSPFAYAANNPVRMTDFLGLGPNDEVKSWKLSFSFAMNSGKIGVGAKVAGVGVAASGYPAGGGCQSISIYFGVENGSFNMGITHTDKQVREETSGSFGPFHGTEGVGKETKRDLSIKNGAQKTEEAKSKKYESGGIGKVTTEDNNNGTTAKVDVVKAEANAFLVGVEAGVSLEYTSEKGSSSPTNTPSTTSSSSPSTTPPSPPITRLIYHIPLNNRAN